MFVLGYLYPRYDKKYEANSSPVSVMTTIVILIHAPYQWSDNEYDMIIIFVWLTDFLAGYD